MADKLIELVIAQKGKGRAFTGTCLANVEADSLWPGGLTDTKSERPVWAMFVGSEKELRPFIANLRLGRQASIVGERSYYRKKDPTIEFLKTAGYRFTWQREGSDAIVTAYLPDLFNLDPGMVDPKGVQFVLLPSAEWVARQTIDPGPIVDHIRSMGELPMGVEFFEGLVPIAYLFAAYLDRRTRCPLLADGRFYMQLLCACLTKGLASMSTGDQYYYGNAPWGYSIRHQFKEHNTQQAGLLPGISFMATQEAIEETLAEQVTLFFEATNGTD